LSAESTATRLEPVSVVPDALRHLRVEHLRAERDFVPGDIGLDAGGDGDALLGAETRHIVRIGGVEQLAMRGRARNQARERQHRQNGPEPQERTLYEMQSL
jgi:hypothetical protein